MNGSLTHLARRFAWSLRRPEPDPLAEAWLVDLLSDAELGLYEAQQELDRAHSVAAAVAARDLLGDQATPSVIVASALHDVGKVEAGLGTFGRVGATVVAAVTPDRWLRRWATAPGWRGRIGRYHLHPELGAAALRAAGSDDLVVTWALEHHRPAGAWSIEAPLAEALVRADA